MSQPSSQDSLSQQEIISQDSFEEIWQTLGRTFSNPEKVVQGVLAEKIIRPYIEYKDHPEPDNLEITVEQKAIRKLPQTDYDLQLLPDSVTQDDGRHVIGVSSSNNIANGVYQCFPMPSSPLYDVTQPQPVKLPPILPNTSYPGEYAFAISFEPNTTSITKATPWIYQADPQKLFVKMQCLCPILFNIRGQPPPGSVVRAIMTYKRPEHYKEIVTRCPNHKNMCKDGVPLQDHVMRCENAATRYEVCPTTGRLSLVIPLNATNTVEGEGYFKELFKFTCFNSCVGGMNRRPTNILFRLECRGQIYGRAVVEVRICASPGRDCNENVNTQKAEKRPPEVTLPINNDVTPVPMPISVSSTSSTISPTTGYPRATVLMSTKKDDVEQPFQFPTAQVNQKKRCCAEVNGVVLSGAKRTCLAENNDEVFTLVVRGRERYNMLLRIKDGLDLLDGISPEKSCEGSGYTNGHPRSPPMEYTKIRERGVEVKKEETDKEQCYCQPDTTSQSSQENLTQSSTTSSQHSSPRSQSGEEYRAWQVTLKRTLNIDTMAHPSRTRPSSQ